MRCRNCGHDNRRNTGKCDNCGFRLEPQSDSGKDQRAAMQISLYDQNSDADTNKEAPNLSSIHKGKSGLIGLIFFLLGAAGTVFIVSTMERAELEPEIDITHESLVEEIPVDSLPILLGTDIVYVFNAEGTSASPRTNVDLSLIPEGTAYSFLGSSSMSIQPVVNFMLQKINSNELRVLVPDSMYAWTDSTETDYMAIAILPLQDDSAAVQPVELKILFTDQWLRCIIEEYNKDIIEPATGYEFNGRTFGLVMNQVVRTVDRRNTDERPVHITLLFPSGSTFGEAMEIAESVFVATDSLGYQGFNLKWVNVTD
ncbi:MAG: hypothetical protein KAH54_10170 [Candidatus Sabulitectum sp.]|nr:hypothetical protein [Candidatus Sabulitectum sp.]